MYKILIFIIIFHAQIISASEYFTPFTKKEWTHQWVFTGLLLTAYKITLDSDYENTQMEETNVILGKKPTDDEVTGYVVIVMALQWIIAYALDHKWRHRFQAGTIMIEVFDVLYAAWAVYTCKNDCKMSDEELEKRKREEGYSIQNAKLSIIRFNYIF